MEDQTTQNPPATEPEPQFAIVELMGHVRIAGRISEESRFGATLGRLDIPTDDGWVTQYFGGSAVYRVTFVSEDAARQVAATCRAQPVHRWELPALREAETVDDADIEDDRDPYEDDDSSPFN